MIAALLTALAVPALAASVTGRFIVSRMQGEPIVSRDGYHAAVLSVGAEQSEVWTIDGRFISEHPKGNAVIRPPVIEAALSNDGKRLAYGNAVFVPGNPFPVGQTVRVNGRPGKRYNEIRGLAFSPYGAGKLHYKARADRAWAVVVESAEGAMMEPEPGAPVMFSDGGFAYTTLAEGAYRLHLNHEPVQGWTAGEVFADPSGKTKASIVRKNYVQTGGKLLGPFGEVQGVVLSPDGKRVMIRTIEDGGRGHQVYVDGEPSGPRMVSVAPDMAFSPAGPAYWFSPAGLGEALYREGVLMVTAGAFAGSPRLSFSPSGRLAVAAQAAEGFVDVYIDGQKTLSGVRRPCRGAGLVWDGEKELHWLSYEPGAGVVLNCASLDGASSPSACVSQATLRSLPPAK